ncbi:MAG: hypothetical protein HDR22_02365 [Lachnospiraceae bacterium]|nr:hypothetical protein [Lachnospiraceae bacterium]
MKLHIIDEKKSSLKDTSYDNDNGKYMVDSQLQVCPFDEVKNWYVKNNIPFANPVPKSNDALFFGEKESFFIEFKNGKIDNGVNFEINKKIYDSLLILFDLNYVDADGNAVNSISYTRFNMNYILVYNEEIYLKAGPTRQTKEGFERQKERQVESKHRDKLYKTIRNLANEGLVKFGLDQFKNYLFKNVYTYTVEEFEKNFVNK